MANHMIEVINPCARRLLMTISAEEILHEKKLKVEELAKDPPKGFRRGSKITQTYLDKEFSKTDLEHFYKTLCYQRVYKLLEKDQLQFVSEPILKSWELKSDNSLYAIFECEIAPAIEKIHFEKVNLEKLTIEMTEEDILKGVELVNKNASKLSQEEIRLYTEQWMRHTVEDVQEKHLHNQVIKTLIEQNRFEHLPIKLVEERYQVLKSESASNQENIAQMEETLKETTHFQITAELLLAAYIRMYQLTPETPRIEQKIKQLAISVRGDQAKLHGLLENPRVIRALEQAALRDQVIDALLKKVTFTTKKMTYTQAVGWPADTSSTTTTLQEESIS